MKIDKNCESIHAIDGNGHPLSAGYQSYECIDYEEPIRLKLAQ